MTRILILMVLALSIPMSARCDSEKTAVSWGGFVDTYYAYDFDKPATFARAYTTQPSRHNEFNVNLGFLEAKLTGDRMRGRFALQAGTSVDANYSNETQMARHIQEAVAGYQVTDRLWIDAGIYLAHIGAESFISRDNWTYTRSLIADYSPYYESGVKASYQFSDVLSGQFHVLNGWQNISETNSNKAIGLQLAYAPSERFSFTYNNFFGNELGSRRRFFNDFILKYAFCSGFQAQASYDYGIQERASSTGLASWQGFSVLGKTQVTKKLSVTTRFEGYIDREQAIVSTGTGNGFVVYGASVNADLSLTRALLWRAELRGLISVDPIFPTITTGSRRDGVVVTSLSLTI